MCTGRDNSSRGIESQGHIGQGQMRKRKRKPGRRGMSLDLNTATESLLTTVFGSEVLKWTIMHKMAKLGILLF